MPRSAKSSSSGGKNTNKIVIPGLTNRVTTRQSGSSIPLESFTHQPIKSESSTHKSKTEASSSQSKQTKADYAIPIQTLQAFQDQGLTHLPRKSWADIASEEESENQDLALTIQNLKNKQITVASPSVAITTTQPKQNPPTTYKAKNCFIPTIQMEPEFWDNNPYKVPSKIFPPDFHFKPISNSKTRQFYEFILVDTDSVSIKHHKDPKDPKTITHSTIQILKVLSPLNFGKDPNAITKFSQNFNPIGFNYWDYQLAWTNVFWLQNKTNRHSWLIYFKNNIKYNFPMWFIQWWDYFGPTKQILPPLVADGFQTFQRRIHLVKNPFPVELHFFSKLSLSWVFSWQYKYGAHENTHQLPVLQKQAFVKWWAQFDTSRADSNKVLAWFQDNKNWLAPANPETCQFLNHRAAITTAIAASSSQDSLEKNLQDILQLIRQNKDKQNEDKQAPGSSKAPMKQSSLPTSPTSSAGSSAFYQNEDDCFGINLDEDC